MIFLNRIRNFTACGFWTFQMTHTCNYSIFHVRKINAFILVILFDNLIDGMIIAVVIAELKSSFKLTITTAMIVFAFRFLYFRNSNHHLH